MKKSRYSDEQIVRILWLSDNAAQSRRKCGLWIRPANATGGNSTRSV